MKENPYGHTRTEQACGRNQTQEWRIASKLNNNEGICSQVTGRSPDDKKYFTGAMKKNPYGHIRTELGLWVQSSAKMVELRMIVVKGT